MFTRHRPGATRNQAGAWRRGLNALRSALGGMRPVLNAYEAGSQGRRFKLWTPTSLGPNAALLRDLKTVRDRSRDSVRNNAWMGKGVGSLVANEIGTGISPRPM